MRKKALGKYTPLWPAPKRWALKCFGGTMSIEEFRSYGGLVEPPIVHFPNEKLYLPIVGGTTQENTPVPGTRMTKTDKQHMHAIETANAETSTLKLKRQKPLQRSESKLENMLGIKKKVQG